MTHKLTILTALLVSLAAPSVTLAQDRSGTPRADSKKTPWIHIEVLEGGEKEAKVKVNLPIKLARTALEMAPDDVMDEGRIRVNHRDFEVKDLRAMWKEVRNAGDAEFVTLQEEDATVKVYRKGSKLFVNVDETRGNKKQVRVEVPVALVDALLAGNGETLNVDAAVAELERMGPGEVVRVHDGDDSVRIWIE